MERVIYPDGAEYFGQVSDGLPHGKGCAFHSNGDVYVGTWIMGVPEGLGVLNREGKRFFGIFKRGHLVR
jgi:hypothetical protein